MPVVTTPETISKPDDAILAYRTDLDLSKGGDDALQLAQRLTMTQQLPGWMRHTTATTKAMGRDHWILTWRPPSILAHTASDKRRHSI